LVSVSVPSSPLIILITGANRGLGLELVSQYAASNSLNVIFAGVRDPQSKSNQALQSLAKQNNNIHIIALDVDDEVSIKSSVSTVNLITDHLDLLINNAGVLGSGRNSLEVTKSDLLSVFNTNVVGAILMIQTYLSLLLRGSNPKVATIGSKLGSNRYADRLGPARLSYSISKAAVNMFTTSFSKLVPEVTFLSIQPGHVKTEMGNTAGKATIEIADSIQAVRRIIDNKNNQNSGEFIDAITGEILPF